MRRSAAWSLLPILLAACGPSTTIDDVDAPPGNQCTGSQTRCTGSSYQTCVDGVFETLETCTATQSCAPSLGCLDCNPTIPNVCVGNDVHTCNGDGTIGGLVESCPAGETCALGHCSGEDGCAEAAELIYVVDDAYRLYAFDPKDNAYTFTAIGSPINCPTGAPLADWPEATPFSMSVDRQARAWVLFTSGQIFHVSTEDASCTSTAWQVGRGGYELFGMGFVTDTAGGTSEKLFINGGSATTAGDGTGEYAWVDPTTLEVHDIGPIDGTVTHSPELTGTGNAELYGYFPGATQFVQQIDKATGEELHRWNMPSLGSDVEIAAWAFAHWGGDFFVFVTTMDWMGSFTPQVWRLDTDSGNASQILSGTSVPVIVGAGVSTCAPVVID